MVTSDTSSENVMVVKVFEPLTFKWNNMSKHWVYLSVRTCELFLCFAAIVRVRVYYVDFFVFFVLRHW